MDKSNISCRDDSNLPAADAQCGHTPKPDSSRNCYLGPCKWQVGSCSGGHTLTPPTEEDIPTPGCTAPPTCPQYETLYSQGTDANGCAILGCFQHPCPSVAACPAGHTAQTSTFVNAGGRSCTQLDECIPPPPSGGGEGTSGGFDSNGEGFGENQGETDANGDGNAD